MDPLSFRPAIGHHLGIVAWLLGESYAPIVKAEPVYWEHEKANWRQFDRDVFAHPGTVGACTFLSCVGDEAVGLGSFDPRPGPVLGVVGHNCILPAHQGQGYGRAQMQEVLRRLAERGIARAIVSTGEHPFFESAQRMYLACGFCESRRFAGGPDPRYRVIEYERELALS
jgi:GNAT superfamily N-acetyltransferase